MWPGKALPSHRLQASQYTLKRGMVRAQSPRWDKVVEGRGNGWTAKVDTCQGSQVAQSSEEAQGLPEDDQVSR